MSRKGSSGQIPTIPSAARNPTSTPIPTIPGPDSHHHPPKQGPQQRTANIIPGLKSCASRRLSRSPSPGSWTKSTSNEDDDFDGEPDEGQLPEIDVEEEVFYRGL
ncbi:hypothetical protein FRC01_008435, partial [Tulasnella sp. 417]